MDTDRGFELFLVTLALVVIALFLLEYLTVILAAIVLAYLLGHPHRVIAPVVGARPAALWLLIVSILVLVVPLILLVDVAVRGVQDLLETVGTDDGESGVGAIERLLEDVFGPELDVQSSVTELIRNGDIMQIVDTVLGMVGGLSEAFIRLTILVFLAYYLLVHGDRLIAWVGEQAPIDESDWTELEARADRLFYAVLVSSVVISVVDGLMVGLGLFLTGFSDVLFWTFLAVFLAFIPLIGSTVIWVPAAAYLVATGSVVPGILLFAYGIVLVGSVDNVLRPFVGANQAGLDPATFIVGVFSGLSLFGFVGVFFGPIALGMAKHVIELFGPANDRTDEAVEGTDEPAGG